MTPLLDCVFSTMSFVKFICGLPLTAQTVFLVQGLYHCSSDSVLYHFTILRLMSCTVADSPEMIGKSARFEESGVYVGPSSLIPTLR